MLSSVVAASSVCIRYTVAFRGPCNLALSSGAPDGREDIEFEAGNEKPEDVTEFCYLGYVGDMLTEEVAAS